MTFSNSNHQQASDEHPFAELGYPGDCEFHAARYGETSILSKGPADAVTFDIPMRDEQQQVVGLNVEDVESMASLIAFAIFHGCESVEERKRIAERAMGEIGRRNLVSKLRDPHTP